MQYPADLRDVVVRRILAHEKIRELERVVPEKRLDERLHVRQGENQHGLAFVLGRASS